MCIHHWGSGVIQCLAWSPALPQHAWIFFIIHILSLNQFLSILYSTPHHVCVLPQYTNAIFPSQIFSNKIDIVCFCLRLTLLLVMSYTCRTEKEQISSALRFGKSLCSHKDEEGSQEQEPEGRRGVSQSQCRSRGTPKPISKTIESSSRHVLIIKTDEHIRVIFSHSYIFPGFRKP